MDRRTRLERLGLLAALVGDDGTGDLSVIHDSADESTTVEELAEIVREGSRRRRPRARAWVMTRTKEPVRGQAGYELFGGGGFNLPRSARSELEAMTADEARARCHRVLLDAARSLRLDE